MTNEHNKALILLNDLLARKQVAPVWFLVCGGSALQAHGTIQRATKDVDIFAERNEFEGISPAYPLSEALQEAIKQVADILKLPDNWLNAATSFLQLPLENYPS